MSNVQVRVKVKQRAGKKVARWHALPTSGVCSMSYVSTEHPPMYQGICLKYYIDVMVLWYLQYLRLVPSRTDFKIA